mgnify:FL=1
MSTEKVKAVIKEDRVIIDDFRRADEIHRNGFYGEFDEKGRLILEPVEALYLVERGRLEVMDSQGRSFDFTELVRYFSKRDKDLWVKYTIYHDLRRRGYIVKPGFSRRVEFRVYERGSNPDREVARYLVCGVVEGIRVDFRDLARMVEDARRAKKELILAVMDRQGDIAYYAVTSISL